MWNATCSALFFVPVFILAYASISPWLYGLPSAQAPDGLYVEGRSHGRRRTGSRRPAVARNALWRGSAGVDGQGHGVANGVDGSRLLAGYFLATTAQP